MFLLTPLILLNSRRVTVVALKSEVIHKSSSLKYRFCALTAFIFSALPPTFFYFLVGGKNEMFPSIPMRSSKLALAILGWCPTGGIAWMLVVHTMRVPTLFIKRRYHTPDAD
jgi:hypothetical protein